MIIVFSAFAFSNIILVKEVGLGLATAVFLDATIIRIMLVPSILKIQKFDSEGDINGNL